MERELEEIGIARGTIIHIDGIPYELAQDTVVLGRVDNSMRPHVLSEGVEAEGQGSDDAG